MEEKYPISCLNLPENAFVLGQVNKERHMLNNKSNRGRMFFFSLQAWDKRNLILYLPNPSFDSLPLSKGESTCTMSTETARLETLKFFFVPRKLQDENTSFVFPYFFTELKIYHCIFLILFTNKDNLLILRRHYKYVWLVGSSYQRCYWELEQLSWNLERCIPMCR